METDAESNIMADLNDPLKDSYIGKASGSIENAWAPTPVVGPATLVFWLTTQVVWQTTSLLL